MSGLLGYAGEVDAKAEQQGCHRGEDEQQGHGIAHALAEDRADGDAVVDFFDAEEGKGDPFDVLGGRGFFDGVARVFVARE